MARTRIVETETVVGNPHAVDAAPPNILVLRRVVEEGFDLGWSASRMPSPSEIRAHAKRLVAVAKLFDATGSGLH